MPRRQPVCRHFGTCGGCRLQHLPPTDYREWKSGQVRSALARRGIENIDIKPLIDAHPATRRRLRLAFSPHAQGASARFSPSVGQGHRRHRRMPDSAAFDRRPAGTAEAMSADTGPGRKGRRVLDHGGRQRPRSPHRYIRAAEPRRSRNTGRHRRRRGPGEARLAGQRRRRR